MCGVLDVCRDDHSKVQEELGGPILPLVFSVGRLQNSLSSSFSGQ